MGVNERISELMHGEIDRVNSPEETRELKACLQGSQDARDRFEQLKQLSEALGRVGQVEPPAGLRESILRAVSSSRSAIPFTRSMRRSPAGGPWLRPAIALAAGVVLGVLGYQLVADVLSGSRWVDPAELTGTMGRIARQELGLSFERGAGAARVAVDAGGDSLRFDVEAAEPLTVSLEYDAGAVGFRGLTQELGELEDLEVGKGRLRWVQHGTQRITVHLLRRNAAPAELRLQFFASSGPVGETRVELPAKDPHDRSR